MTRRVISWLLLGTALAKPARVIEGPGEKAAVYLGSKEDAADTVALAQEGITAIIDVTATEVSKTKDRFAFPLDEWQGSVEFHAQVSAFVDSHLANGNSVLVHCKKGCHDGGAVVIGLLIDKGSSLAVAYGDVYLKRPCIEVLWWPENIEHTRQLVALEKKGKGDDEL